MPAEPPRREDDVRAIDAAVAALEGQRALLGDAVVDTAVAPLLERRAALLARQTGEQRRLVTVVFADLVDFTAMSAALDAEDTRTVVDAYFRRWTALIEEHGGVVEKFIGDAVMAVFGLYVSREEDAGQAVRAALGMVGELDELNRTWVAEHGVRLRVRVGIDTGEVVVSTLGERAGHEFVAVGQTVNRASRLQSAAPPDGVLISAATHRLVRGRFGFEPVAGLHLKGLDGEVPAYRVLAERPRAFLVEHDGTVAGVTVPTVGRERELALLREVVEDVAAEGRWRVVTVVGDAGVGKSRLMFELDRWLTERPERTWWFRGRATPSDAARPLALLRTVLASRFGIADSDPPATVQAKLRQGFAESAPGAGPAADPDALGDRGPAAGPVVDPAVDVVAAWLGFPTEALPAARDPQALRDAATAALATYFARLTEVAPVVVLVEDLHWADDASLHWFDAADDLFADRAVVVVATARPTLLERRPHWGEGLAHHQRLTLEPLSRRRSRELLTRLLGVDEPPADLDALVLDAAEGNPFYLEELVALLVESGALVRDAGDGDQDGAGPGAAPGWRVVADPLGRALVPTTLRGVLQARLDALGGEARTLLQRAAVVGRVFWGEAVARLVAGPDGPHQPQPGTDPGDDPAPVPAPALAPGIDPLLDQLRRHDLVRRRASSAFESTTEYMFAHALLRDVAYDGVLRARRRDYHRLAAGWLTHVTERAGRTEEYAAVIAEHLDLAGDPAAPAWYLRAGRRAAAVHAAEEAERLLARALDLAEPDDPALRFDALAEREEVRERVGDRAAQADDLDRLDALAAQLPDDDPRHVRLALARSRTAFGTSDYPVASAQARRAVDRATTDAERAAALLAWGKALTWTFDLADATDVLDRALAAARSAGSAQLEAETLRYLSMVQINGGDYAAALRLVEAAHAVNVRHGDVDGQTATLYQTAAVSYHLGRYEEALTTTEQALPLLRASGYRYRLGVALGNLASFATACGRWDDAGRWARESLELVLPLADGEAVAVARINLAAVAQRSGDLARAREELVAAAGVAGAAACADMEAGALARLATVELDAGRRDEALAAAAAAVARSADVVASKERAELAVRCAWVLLAADRPDEAGELLDGARQGVADAATHRSLLLEHTAACARLALTRGEHDGAARLGLSAVPDLAPATLRATGSPADVVSALARALAGVDDPVVRGAVADARAWLATDAEGTLPSSPGGR